MSELPIENEIFAFGKKIVAAAQTVIDSSEERARLQSEAAAKAAADHSDMNTITVLNAAAKVQHEIHRMQGLLRFSPDANGAYIARCAPDHLIVPALGGYLTARFGNTPWLVIDEKRLLCLSCHPPQKAEILQINTNIFENKQQTADQNYDEWEQLWKHYHKTINNESRKNTNLQRQLMPKRYWKYLPEV